ncbi:MAG: sugar transferase [Actinomycetota bacterium]
MSSLSTPTNTIRLRSRELATIAAQADGALDLRERPEDGGISIRFEDQVSVSHEPVVTADGSILLHPVLIDPPPLSTRLAVRTFDLVVAVTALVLLAPVMVAVAVAVKLDSPGPVLYGSPRLGHRKPRFNAWKFRSMMPDADAALERLLATDPEAAREYRIYHKLKDDPRLTRVGRVIRQTSLDELPQLINILRGEMSIVGPRPKALHEGEAYGPFLELILQIRPGLTGLWQVSGRNRLPVKDRVILDVEYARNRSLGLDVLICVRTFLQLWRPGKHGAY